MRRRQTIASTEESGSMPRFRAIPLTAFACALGVALGAQANTASAQADCPNAGLRAGVASHLPDCRAYEQVSPTEKNGSDVGNIPLTNFGAGGPSSPSGDAVAFTAYGALSNTQWGGGGTLLYLSRRGDAAWTTTALIPRPVDTGGLTIFTNSIMGFTPDLTGSLLVSGVGLTSEAPNDRNYYRQDNLSGAITKVGDVSTSTLQSGAQVSDDLNHVALGTGDELTADPGQPPAGSLRVYEFANGQPRLVARRPGDDTPFPNASALGENLGLVSTTGALSDDGRHIFFTTSEGSDPQAIYRRTDGATTALASPSQRTTPDPNGADAKVFLAATDDGNRVFLRSREQLTDDANDSTGAGRGDLYRYDFVEDELIDLSVGTSDPAPAEVEQVVDFSTTGDRVYFVARAKLVPDTVDGPNPVDDAPNLYLWEEAESSQGALRFIGTLDPADRSSIWDASLAKTANATPSGRHLVFLSVANLTAFDAEGKPQVYRYDADAGQNGQLACLSCNFGSAPTGAAELPAVTNGGAQLGSAPRTISDDGRQVVMSTPDPLLARDANGRYDAYMWQDGERRLLSSGRSTDDSYAFAISAVGDDAFFRTRESLLAQDDDTLTDLYTARVGGGLILQHLPPVAGCAEDECQGVPSRQPNAQAPASVGLQGRGNVEVGEKRLALFALSAAVLRKAARTGVLTAVRVRSSAAGRIGVVVSGRVGKRRLRVGRASRRLSKPGVARFRVPLSAAARKQLKAAGVLRLRIVARSSGARQRSVKATLRRTGR